MVVGFLTAEKQRCYGRYAGDPSRAQLDRYFHLDAADRELVDVRRGEHNRLGFAVQLGTVRFLGTFLPNPTDVPELVVVHVAAQLGIADPGMFKGYAQRRSTQWEHTEQIRTAYGYRDFSDPAVQAELTGWLTARARTTADRPSVLFDRATARLVEDKVLLPGPSLRAAHHHRPRTGHAAAAHRARRPARGEQRHHLNGLLSVEETTRTSRLERLRRGPTSVTAAGCSVPWTGWARCASSVWMSWTCPRCHPAASPASRAMRRQPGRRLCPGWPSRGGPPPCSPWPGSWKPTPATTCSTCWTGCSPDY